MITIYHNPRCRKSREGLEVLEKSGRKYNVIRYLEDPPGRDEIKQLLGYLGIPAKKLIRTNESVWRSEYKGKTLSEEALIDAMAKYPKLIERPIVIKDKKAVVGRPAELIRQLLES